MSGLQQQSMDQKNQLNGCLWQQPLRNQTLSDSSWHLFDFQGW
jgi:hypothetical protein